MSHTDKSRCKPVAALLQESLQIVLLAVLLTNTGRLSAGEQASPDSATVQDFEKRVQDYMKMRQPLVKQIPSLKPTKASEAIREHQKALAASIRDARQEAHQGDIFTPEITAEFRHLIGQTMGGSEAERIRKSLRHSEPVALTLHVNDSYPPRVPLQSTPPTLLMTLPKLPKELDYRLIGRTLALRDCEADIIIDLIPDAIPIA